MWYWGERKKSHVEQGCHNQLILEKNYTGDGRRRMVYAARTPTRVRGSK